MLHTLSFGTTNAKLVKQNTATFSLPAGYTCPGARDCHSWYNREEKKLYDGKHQEYRCYAAHQESYLPSLRDSVDRNLSMLKAAPSVEAMASLICLSLPKKFKFIRVHQNGDFFSGDYFLAWMEVARRNPNIGFYAYTKSIPTWAKYKSMVPPNFALTASIGGKFDKIAEKNNFRTARVVFHPEEAEALGLEIDHDDSHARNPKGGDFALLIHAMGQAGSKHNQAISRLRKEDIKFEYSRKTADVKFDYSNKRKRPAPGPKRSLRKIR